MYSFTGVVPSDSPLPKTNNETMFLLVERTPEDYIILGIFKSLNDTLDAFKQDERLQSYVSLLQIEEVPVGTLLVEQRSNKSSYISGAIHSYDLKGNILK